jgi:hypothetical protein
MEIGIDSFAAASIGEGSEKGRNSVAAMEQLLERIARADDVGLDVFGMGSIIERNFLIRPLL